MGFLTSWGEKMGLYRATPATPPGPPVDPAATSIAKKTLTIRDLQAQLPDVSPSVFEKAAGTSPPEPAAAKTAPKTKAPRPLAFDFAKVYEAARVAAPPHGWTVERVIKLLQTDQFKTMAAETIKQSLLGMLAAESVPATDVVRDAIARDKAIDAFELHLRRKLEERKGQAREKGESNRREIEALKAAIGDLERASAEADDLARQEEVDLQNWVDTAKRAKEEELARAVSFLTAEPVVSIGNATPPPPGAEEKPAPPAPMIAAQKPAPKGPLPPAKGGK
jgi:hypothetical protein